MSDKKITTAKIRSELWKTQDFMAFPENSDSKLLISLATNIKKTKDNALIEQVIFNYESILREMELNDSLEFVHKNKVASILDDSFKIAKVSEVTQRLSSDAFETVKRVSEENKYDSLVALYREDNELEPLIFGIFVSDTHSVYLRMYHIPTNDTNKSEIQELFPELELFQKAETLDNIQVSDVKESIALLKDKSKVFRIEDKKQEYVKIPEVGYSSVDKNLPLMEKMKQYLKIYFNL